ncbi:MAG TPA: hypothetical protein VMG60_22990 [Burkholderiaceae bacterium]|nr:hypothetical protein [Burkholderiaceae bacterium]
MKVAPALLCCLALAGCAGVDPYARAPISAHLQRTDQVGECARRFQRIDRAIEKAGVRDAQAAQVEGFPYLRVDRLTAGLGPADGSADADRAWRERMLALDREARAIELANGGPQVGSLRDAAALDDCRAQLAAEDRSAAGLAQAARVPDDYSQAMHAVGLYPITKYALASSIRKWHDEVRVSHALPPEKLPRLGEAVRYVPRPPQLLATLDALPLPALDALGVPVLTPGLTEALIARYAPAIEVDTVDGNDRLGQLAWGDAGRQVVADTTRPVAYARITYTRFAGSIAPQIVYTFWFPARTAQDSSDASAGTLDGLVWRVMLGDDLKPLVSDTIHSCGRYHLFYPSARVRERAGPIPGEELDDESRFVPQRIDVLNDGERQLLYVAARTHYVRRVAVTADESAGGVQYELRDENDLRSLPWPNDAAPRGTRSAYGPDGLIAGTERSERWFLWPSGVKSVGQMRQWGHHATALVGHRHFDDPNLFDRYFELAGEGSDPR